MSEEIHASLAIRDCLPGEHRVDAGYPTTAAIVAARCERGVALHGPVAANITAQSSATGGFRGPRTQ
ncbi:hypothetical protein GT002_35695 [Streptomyces sp. SID4917]|nr:hypothetical protein [Streptomyces sp. SID4917]SCG07228.1 hypothetical protein GA0115259_111115 [Streptomyces sp. MnatMP-M17]